MSQPPEYNENDTPGLPVCNDCQASLGDYFRQSLAGIEREDKAVTEHLLECSACSLVFVDAFDFMTGTPIKLLMDSWLEIDAAPSQPALNGLLGLAQTQVTASENVADRRATARALSTIGMIRRQQKDEEEARLVHDLGLQFARDHDDLTSRMISSGDLGYMALANRDYQAALEHLQDANRSAIDLTDESAQARIHVLLGQTWVGFGDIEKARVQYVAALDAANRSSFVLGTEVARNRLDALPISVSAAGTEPGPNLLSSFLSALRQPRYAFAPEGEKVLVVNTAQELPLQVISGPSVDDQGNLELTVQMGQASLNAIPSDFYIDILFVPTAGIIHTESVTPEKRRQLRTGRGLRLEAEIPGIEGVQDESSTQSSSRESVEGRRLPATSIVLRIWWDEGAAS